MQTGRLYIPEAVALSRTEAYGYFFFFFAVLGFELRAYTLSHTTNPVL
jgi:hypothetical protein